MGLVFRLIRWSLAGAVVFGLVTWVALEGQDVGVLRTRADPNDWRTTHVWVAEGDGGALWLEAATPERPWFLDVLRDPEVELERAGATTLWRAVPVEDAEAHARIRAMLRHKYGWADRWVALLQDTSHSVAVRLDPR